MKGVQAAVLGGSALILLILALRLTLKNHLPHRLFPALWCIAAIRFLLPVEIPTRLSVWNLLHTPTAAQADGVISDVLTPFPSCVSAVRSSRSRWAGLETAALDRDRGDSCCILWNRLCLHDTPFSVSAYFAAAVRRCTAGTVPFYTRPENLHDREPPRAADVRHFPSDGAAAGRSAGRSGTVSACPGARIGAYPPQRLPA